MAAGRLPTKKERDRTRVLYLRRIARDALATEGYSTEERETTTGSVMLSVVVLGEVYNITITKARS